MKIFSWNCRGLSNPRVIPNLRNLAQRHHPDIIFLSETLATTQKLERVCVALKFDACLAIDVVGRSGGIAILWKKNYKCNVMNFSRNFINILVEDSDKGEWRLSCYYGYPERSRRRLAWDMICDIHQMSDIPWCIIRDFNDLLSQNDKQGLHPHPNWLCTGFQQTVSDCNLTDIALEGHPFTWTKSRGTDHMVEERLDRALATTKWFLLFPNAKLRNLLASHSDHSPILLCCEPVQNYQKNHSFKFENWWLKEDVIKDVINQGWNSAALHTLVNCIASYSSNLQQWNKRRVRKNKAEKDSIMQRMEFYRNNNGQYESEQYLVAYHELNKVLVREETYCRQRAKMFWLREGDCNTKFFHRSASIRRNSQKIAMLRNEEDVTFRDQEGMCGVAKQYFDELFEPNRGVYDPVLNHIQSVITTEDNNMLTASITKEEFLQR